MFGFVSVIFLFYFEFGSIFFMQHSPSEMAIRFWGNYEIRNHIKTPSGKTFTLLNLPYYYSGFIDKYLDEKL